MADKKTQEAICAAELGAGLMLRDEIRVCHHCDGLFVPRVWSQRFCLPECREAASGADIIEPDCGDFTGIIDSGPEPQGVEDIMLRQVYADMELCDGVYDTWD